MIRNSSVSDNASINLDTSIGGLAVFGEVLIENTVIAGNRAMRKLEAGGMLYGPTAIPFGGDEIPTTLTLRRVTFSENMFVSTGSTGGFEVSAGGLASSGRVVVTDLNGTGNSHEEAVAGDGGNGAGGIAVLDGELSSTAAPSPRTKRTAYPAGYWCSLMRSVPTSRTRLSAAARLPLALETFSPSLRPGWLAAP